MPFLRVDFSPYYQNNNRTDSLRRDQAVSVLTANTGYNYQLGPLNGNTSLIFSRQWGKSLDSTGTFQSNLYTLSQVLSLGGASLVLSGTYMEYAYSDDLQETLTLDGNVSVLLFKRINLALGGNWLEEREGLSRKSYYANLSFPIIKNLSCEWQYQRFFYNDPTGFIPFQNEYQARAIISYRW
ncbi:MAG: hypothetical protein AAF206_11185 [Bacteroidota bacterium]